MVVVQPQQTVSIQPRERIGEKFIVGKKLGSGSFGEIFECQNVQNGQKCAVKLEHAKSKYPQLLSEARICKLLGLSKRSIGIPKIYWYGRSGMNNAMVMELLGDNLETLFKKCDKKFTLKCVLQIVDQLLKRIEYVHSKNFIHRDIKPENFVLGVGKKNHLIYVVDFGLAKKYRDSQHIHIPFKEGISLTGTARYASINNHNGFEQSRRDDLECLGYLFVYFLRGNLPWQSLKAKTKQDKYRMIRRTKTQVKLPQLIEKHPEQFGTYIKYCRSLGFEDKPDYAYVRKLFYDLYTKMGYQQDRLFDWDLLENGDGSQKSEDGSDC